MTRVAAPKLVGHAALGAVLTVLGLALGRPEPTLLGAPFLFALLVGAALARRPEVRAAVRVAPTEAVEGDEAEVTVDLTADGPVARAEVALLLPAGLAAVEPGTVAAVALRPGETKRVRFGVACRQWGGYGLGTVRVRARDPLRFFADEGTFDQRQALRVFPRPESFRSLLRPAETQPWAGNRLARAKGDGIEYADIRPFAAGDRVRSINWRLTARRGELHVNERHPERNSDVILFLDAFSDVARDGEGTRLQAVRGAAALAERYLAAQDRVGLVTFGGILHWLGPASGPTQRQRMVEALIETDVVFSYAWKALSAIPPRMLPPGALVVALSPLLDERSVNALYDLAARGIDLAILEVAPEPFAAPSGERNGDVAFRVWLMEREAVRERFRQLGVPIATWRDGEPMEQALAELAACRRRPRLARA